MKTFQQLIEATGVSTKGLARLLGVRYDTIRNWKYEKCKVPHRVIEEMMEYANQAERIFKSRDDHE